MKIKRILLVALVGALTSFGCSSDKQTSDPDAKVTLSYMMWDASALPTYKKLAADFKQENPNITVEVQALPNDQYWTKLQTQASSKSLPDVFWINEPNFRLYASGGALEPLTELVQRGDFDPANYVAAQIASYTIDGEIYAAPTSSSTMAVWYNEKLFKQAGVEPPAQGWTLQDFQQRAVQIATKLKDKRVFGAASAPYAGQETYYNTILQSGGFVISEDRKKSGYDDPSTIAGIKVWADLIEQGAAPTVEQLNDTLADQYFLSGKLAMLWSGPWHANWFSDAKIVDDIKVAPLPQGSADVVTTVQGGADAVSAFSENKAAAQKFQAYLASETAQRSFGKGGHGLPAYTEAADSFVEAFPAWDLDVFVESAERAAPYPVSLNTEAWNKLENEYITQAYSGEQSVQAASEQLAKAMNAVLAEED